MLKILVVVDVQNDFITGALKNPAAQVTLPRIVKRVNAAAEHKEMIIFTQDTHFEESYSTSLEGKTLPIHCFYRTEGWEVAPEVKKFATFSIYKKTFGSFDLANTILNIASNLNQKEEDLEIELCGFCTSICVLANAVVLRAMSPNAKILVDSNLCADVKESAHLAALEVLRAQQIEVRE